MQNRRWATSQENCFLEPVQDAASVGAVTTASLAWQQELLCAEQQLGAVPSLPQILAEEAGLLTELATLEADLAQLQGVMQGALVQVNQCQVAAVQQQVAVAATTAEASWSPLQREEEGAEAAVRTEVSLALLEQAADALAGVLDRVSAQQLAIDATRARLEGLGALREQSQAALGHTADIAVQTQQQREWTYVYAAEMAEVGPDDPDSALQERMATREAAGTFDCDTFVVHCLEEAGYDLDAVIVVGGQETTVRRVVMLHAETIFRAELQLDAPEGDAMGKGEKLAALKGMLEAEDPRMKGVVSALTLSGQGAEIHEMNDLRPGDLVQYWFNTTTEGLAGVNGHAVVVHRVLAEGGTLDERSRPSDAAPVGRVRAVSLLSAHAKVKGNDVYTKQPQDLDRAFAEWFGVRPAGSPWRSGGPPTPPVADAGATPSPMKG